MSGHYRLQPLKLRRAEHMACSTYPLSVYSKLLEKGRPIIRLHSRNKIKFKLHKQVYEKYLKSPLSYGITLWDRFPEPVQRSSTKVEFKQGIKSHLSELIIPVLK